MGTKKEKNEIEIAEEIINKYWREITLIAGIIISLGNGPIGTIIAIAGAYSIGKRSKENKEKEEKKV